MVEDIFDRDAIAFIISKCIKGSVSPSDASSFFKKKCDDTLNIVVSQHKDLVVLKVNG